MNDYEDVSESKGSFTLVDKSSFMTGLEPFSD